MSTFAIVFLAALATSMLAIAQGKDLYHSITGGTPVGPAAIGPPMLPNPSPAPQEEAASRTPSAAAGRLIDRDTGQSAKTSGLISRPEGTEGQRARPRAVLREMGRRVPLADGILALPAVAFYGAPVILDVPGLRVRRCARGRICQALRPIIVPRCRSD